MTRRGLEIRVGLVIVLASAILIFGVMWLQKFKFTESRYSFFVHFDQVGGLVADDPIMFNGVEAGRVRAVDLRTSDVVVELALRQGTMVPADSRIQLKSIGIMGERFVAITAGDATRTIEPGDSLHGEFLAGMSELMGSAGEIASEVAETTRNLREVVGMLLQEEQLKTSLNNLSDASANLREITETNAPRIESAMESLERVGTRLDRLIGGHYADLDSSLSAFAGAGRRLNDVVDGLAGVSADLKDITARINSGEGTLGKLVSDDEVLERINKTLGSLDALIIDMKLHPGRYVTLKLF